MAAIARCLRFDGASVAALAALRAKLKSSDDAVLAMTLALEEQRKRAATNETLQHLISRRVALAQPGVEKNSEPMDTRLCSAPC